MVDSSYLTTIGTPLPSNPPAVRLISEMSLISVDANAKAAAAYQLCQVLPGGSP